MLRDADRLLSGLYQVEIHPCLGHGMLPTNTTFLPERLNKTDTAASQWPSMDEPENDKSEESPAPPQENSDNNVKSNDSEQPEVLVQI